jgi:hypothetical protein
MASKPGNRKMTCACDLYQGSRPTFDTGIPWAPQYKGHIRQTKNTAIIDPKEFHSCFCKASGGKAQYYPIVAVGETVDVVNREGN